MGDMCNVKRVDLLIEPISTLTLLPPQPWPSRRSSLDDDEKIDGVDIAMEDLSTGSSSRTNSHATLPEVEFGHGNDALDMERLGKKQEFKRNLSFLHILGFTSIFMATWEDILITTNAGLINGGLAGLFWEYILTYLAYATIVLSLAEMSSMSPTSGGQYHWISEFAPPQYQKLLSYLAGWLTTMAWLTSVSAGGFVMSTTLQALVDVESPGFLFTRWQATLVTMLFLLVAVWFNTKGHSRLPRIDTVSLFLHMGGFVLTLLPLAILAPKNTLSDVVSSFTESGGWKSVGLSSLVGQVTILFCFQGADGVVYISEEVHDASNVVPRCMIYSYLLNGAMGFFMLVTMLLCISDLDSTIHSPAPFVSVFSSTGYPALTLFLTLILCILNLGSNITALTATSRVMWAFARDNGLPFAQWLSKVHPRSQVPVHAILVTSGIAMALCTINLASSIAFNIIISANLVALLSVYMISIGCVLLRRLRRQPLPRARWSLGRWGLPINAVAFVYAGVALVFSCFPVEAHVTPDTANWAPLILAVVLGAALVLFFLHGRTRYEGPSVLVQRAGEGCEPIIGAHINDGDDDEESECLTARY